MLSHLESLHIDFNPPPSRPDRPNRWPPLPTTCSIFPALTRILFFGDSDYLEDLVARIDAPLLDSIGIIFCRSFISDIPQLAQFMRRTTRIQGELQALKEAYVHIDDYGIVVQSPPRPSTTDKMPALRISCGGYGWQYSYLVQAFTSLFPSIFMVERLYIYGTMSRLSQDDVEDIELLECFPAFTPVKYLYVLTAFAEIVFSPTLQEHVGERLTDLLPSLESLCLEEVQPSEPLREAIGQFVGARRLLGRPVAISYWNWVEGLGLN